MDEIQWNIREGYKNFWTGFVLNFLRDIYIFIMQILEFIDY